MRKLLLFGALLCALCSCGSGNSKKGNIHNGHEWVDLGLPSGLKWATCNVGASSPEENGDYFAWADTSPERRKDNSIPPYNKRFRGDFSGDSSRDAATANWGGSWRTPREAEFQELIDNCTWTLTTQDGCEGFEVTGPSGNSIFLPKYNFNRSIRYWSSTSADDNIAWLLSYDAWGQAEMDADYCGYGRCVRPVLD